MNRPAHGTAAVTAAVVLLAGCTTTGRSGPPAPSTAGALPPTASPAAATIAPEPDDDEEEVSRPVPTPPAPAAGQVADAFARAWARPHLPAEQWWAGVAAHAWPAYGEQLKTVDPGRIPAHAVTGPPQPLSSTTSTTVWAVPTDAGTLRVTVAQRAGRWLVSTVTIDGPGR